jgi:PAS domain S-box-containing protein
MATILIVDDVAANRARLARVLSGQGHHLLEATDGRQALAEVANTRPDLVITDLLMPVMGGYELVKQLRLDPATSGIPVLFYTAPYAEREARALALADGIPWVLAKSAAADEVLTIVERVLGEGAPSRGTGEEAPRAAAYRQEQLRLLTVQMSAGVEDLSAANIRLRALVNIGLELGSTSDPDSLCQGVCSNAVDLFGATYASLGILDPDGRTVRCFTTFGTEADDWLVPGDTVSGLLASVVAQHRIFRGENPGGNPASLDLPAGHPEVQSVLAVPIASVGQAHGWIKLVGNEGRSFSEEDEDLLLALAGQVGRIYELERESLELRQAEAALRRERDRSRQYLDVAEVLILALDESGRVTLVNRHACTLLGWTAKELLGRNWFETCLPVRCRAEVRRLEAAARQGDPSVVANPILTRSGEERLIEWRPTVTRDHAGNPTGTLSSGTDITDRELAATTLRQAEEQMRFALESANVGIWDWDVSRGVLQWSATLEAQYGLEPGTFGGTFDDFMAGIHPDDRAGVRDIMTRAGATGEDFTVEHRAVWPNGTVRWLSGAGGIRLGQDGRPIRGLGTSMDITARHALEEQYRQAQKMEAVGRLAGGVAHDFNNLLTVILGYCQILLAEGTPADPRRADIAEIEKAALSAATVTRQLLAFSRKEIIEPTVLDLNEVIAAMGLLVERLIGDDIQVVQVLRTGLAPIRADRGQVEQVVMNLALNARDAMPGGGRLTIETANITLDHDYAAAHLAVAPGEYVRLTVSDTGSGMTPEVQARLFEPFFTTKAPGKGTGLGLATVHGIVARTGGTVHVYSEVGKGTSFQVYFPSHGAATLVTEQLATVLPDAVGGQTVLVVEDMAALRRLIVTMLAHQGYTVLAAANGKEALREFERHGSVDVLLTDVVMPGHSGPELVELIRERQPALKIIYMSGYTEDTIAHHGVLQPGIAFLHKPFTADLLDRKLREVLTE